jgi:hypothetical protein
MWDGVVIFEVKIDDREGIISHQGDGAAGHVVKSGSVLFHIGDAMVTPKRIGPNGIPVLAQFPREAQVSMGGAVAGHLTTENLNGRTMGLKPEGFVLSMSLGSMLEKGRTKVSNPWAR